VARAFYRDALGMTEVEKPELLKPRGGCWFRAGAAEIHIGVEEGFAPAKKAHPALAVDDLDALAARLADLGYPVTWDNETIPGRRRFHTAGRRHNGRRPCAA